VKTEVGALLFYFFLNLPACPRILNFMKMDEDERREYEEYLDSLRYQASMFESSYKVGEMKGEEKGRQEREKEIAKKMKKKGTEIELISEITGLSQEVIEKL
jgi:predicted transposase/invertase (TIGR01784 family)